MEFLSSKYLTTMCIISHHHKLFFSFDEMDVGREGGKDIVSLTSYTIPI
jgi:hypothetical protein